MCLPYKLLKTNLQFASDFLSLQWFFSYIYSSPGFLVKPHDSLSASKLHYPVVHENKKSVEPKVVVFIRPITNRFLYWYVISWPNVIHVEFESCCIYFFRFCSENGKRFLCCGCVLLLVYSPIIYICENTHVRGQNRKDWKHPFEKTFQKFNRVSDLQ